jgi:subtilisin family serine protease
MKAGACLIAAVLLLAGGLFSVGHPTVAIPARDNGTHREVRESVSPQGDLHTQFGEQPQQPTAVHDAEGRWRREDYFDTKANRMVGIAGGEVMVRFRAGLPETDVARWIRALGAQVLRRQNKLGLYRLRIPERQTVAGFVALYRSHPDLALIEPNYVLVVKGAADMPNDPLFASQWALERIGVRKAWEVTRGSSEVTIAVIDTGIDPAHPDLAGKLVPGWNAIGQDTNTADDHGHGTAVAGVIGAATNNAIGIAGVCPECRLMPIKALDASGEGTYADVIEAIVYAVDHGARVLNLSFGGYAYSQMLSDAIDYAYSKGAIILAAAGNEASSEPIYPAAYANVIAVSATDRYNALWPSSNTGSYIKLAAPGAGILTTGLGGQFTQVSGTSLSAAHVSGIAALIVSANPSLSNTYVEQVLCQTAEVAVNGQEPGFGRGIVSGARSLEAAGPGPAGFHDVALTGLRVEPTVFNIGDSARIIVTVRNQGTFTEAGLLVRVLVNDQQIALPLIIASLAPGQSSEASFDWTPTASSTDNSLVIKAQVLPVPGETETANNTKRLSFGYDADGKVHALYANKPFVHSWVALQAWSLLPPNSALRSEVGSYLYGYGYGYDYTPRGQYTGGPAAAAPEDFLFGKIPGEAPPRDKTWDDEYAVPAQWDRDRKQGSSVIEGTWEEDEDEYAVVRWWDKDSSVNHFWDPDAGYNAGLRTIILEPFLNTPLLREPDSNLTQAEQWWKDALQAYRSTPSKPALAYYYLGRVVHLLGDLAVPEHVHNDLHLGGARIPNTDLHLLKNEYSNYEMYTRMYYRDYTATEADRRRGPLRVAALPLEFPSYPDAPSGGYDPFLARLFYNQAQFTQFFDSSHFAGNSEEYAGRHIENTELEEATREPQRQAYQAIDYIGLGCDGRPVDDNNDNEGVNPGTTVTVVWEKRDPSSPSGWGQPLDLYQGPEVNSKYYFDLSRSKGQMMY